MNDEVFAQGEEQEMMEHEKMNGVAEQEALSSRVAANDAIHEEEKLAA